MNSPDSTAPIAGRKWPIRAFVSGVAAGVAAGVLELAGQGLGRWLAIAALVLLIVSLDALADDWFAARRGERAATDADASGSARQRTWDSRWLYVCVVIGVVVGIVLSFSDGT